jgi:predicted small lipoprotein YifL
MKRLLTALTAVALAFGLAACEEGPFEEGGKSIDKAGERAKDKVEDATN